MDGFRHQFLAGPRFTAQQYGRIHFRHFTDHGEQLLHRFAAAHQFIVLHAARHLFPQQDVLVDDLLLLQQFLHQQRQLLRLERLHQVVVGAELHGVHRRLHRTEGGDHDHQGLRVVFFDVFEHLDAAHLRHLYVQKHQVVILGDEHFQGFFAAIGPRHEIARFLQPADEGLSDDQFIIDHQDSYATQHMVSFLSL